MKTSQKYFSFMLVFLALSCAKEDTKPTTNSNNGNNNNGTTVTAPTFDASVASTTEGITDVSFKISSTLKDNGGSSVTQYGHVWKIVGEPTIADSKTELGASSGPFPLKFTSEIKGLQANTLYNVRAYATNDKGTTYGPIKTERTLVAKSAFFTRATWTAEETNFSKGGYNNHATLLLNDKLYILGGDAPETNIYRNTPEFILTKDFWEYDLISKKWAQLPNVPTEVWSRDIHFIYDGKIFIINTNTLYEYSLVDKKWSTKTKLPTKFENAIGGFPNYIVHGDLLYIFTTSKSTVPSQSLHLKTFEIQDLPKVQTEGNDFWSISQPASFNEKEIYFWVGLNNTPATGQTPKVYTYSYNIETKSFNNIGLVKDLFPTALLIPKIVFIKDGFAYCHNGSSTGGYPSYRIDLSKNSFSGLISLPQTFPNAPKPQFESKVFVSDGKSIIYTILGLADYTLQLNDPKRFSKNLYTLKLQ